jgi:hypothetical protein
VLAELLAQEHCGVSHASGDADALARLLSDLCDAPAKTRQMSHNSGELFRRVFTAERVYGEMMAHLEHVAVSTGKPSLPKGVAA